MLNRYERWEKLSHAKYLLRHVAVQAEKHDVGSDFEIILFPIFFFLVIVVAVILDRVLLGQN